MRVSTRGGVIAELAVVAGMGLIAIAALVALVVLGVRWFSGESREQASDSNAAAAQSMGTFTDTRDSKTYKTVEIGGKVWMAQNLNYKPDSGRSWCYDNNLYNCTKYGRLYDWNTALTVCPAGWRLSSVYDWDNLLLAIGGERESHISESDQFFAWGGAGNKLKSKKGWKSLKDSSSGNGTDEFGFTAVPGGAIFHTDGDFDRLGAYANWWTATEFDENRAVWLYVNYFRDLAVERFDDKGNGLSARCVADSGGGNGNPFDSEERKKNEALTQTDVEQREKAADEKIARLSDYFTDSRDGRIYRTIKINKARWMAENLNYKTPVGSWCYGDADSNCVKYGRLYEWYSANTSCPAGWHLPSRVEWDDLGKAVGGKIRPVEETGTVDWMEVGIKLKAKLDLNGGGTDAYGFSALPGGFRDNENRFNKTGTRAYWWTADTYRRNSAYFRFLIYDNDRFDGYLVENALFRNNGLSVRCVADSR